MYVCAPVFVYVCVYVCVHVCMHACMHACMYVCMHACMYMCMYAVFTRSLYEKNAEDNAICWQDGTLDFKPFVAKLYLIIIICNKGADDFVIQLYLSLVLSTSRPQNLRGRRCIAEAVFDKKTIRKVR